MTYICTLIFALIFALRSIFTPLLHLLSQEGRGWRSSVAGELPDPVSRTSDSQITCISLFFISFVPYFVGFKLHLQTLVQ